MDEAEASLPFDPPESDEFASDPSFAGLAGLFELVPISFWSLLEAFLLLVELDSEFVDDVFWDSDSELSVEPLSELASEESVPLFAEPCWFDCDCEFSCEPGFGCAFCVELGTLLELG